MHALQLNNELNIKRNHRAEIINMFGSNTTPKVKKTKKNVAHAADPVRSLDDIRAIQNYFLNKNQIRNYALFTVGICSGLRVSDLFALKLYHIIKKT